MSADPQKNFSYNPNVSYPDTSKQSANTSYPANNSNSNVVISGIAPQSPELYVAEQQQSKWST